MTGRQRGVVAIAVVPGPPLLLPGATGGPVAEVEELRDACVAALRAVAEQRPDRIVLVGGARPGERLPPLSERVGRALLDQAGVHAAVDQVLVGADAPAAECVAVGRAIASGDDRLGLLVVGDGSARRSVKAPGYLDDRAGPFDDQVVAALRTADASALADVDAALAGELLAAGRAAWQVLAGVLSSTDQRFAVSEHYVGDPFGVLYPVFSYTRERTSAAARSTSIC